MSGRYADFDDRADFEIHFDELYKAAIEGRTSGPIHYNRGNELIKLQNKFQKHTDLEVFINKSTFPYSINVSWKDLLPEQREKVQKKMYRQGPWDLGRLYEVKQYSRQECLFSASMAHEFCKIKLKLPDTFSDDVIGEIRKIDDNTSFLFFGDKNVVPRWGPKWEEGGYCFYISDIKIATMMRIAYGIEYELTESNI
jgi:hypothetical protein